MKVLPVLLVILLLMPLISVNVHADDGREITGDWIISDEKIVRGQNITLQGKLKILSGGLTLIDSNIKIRCYEDGQFYVRVSSGAYLHMYNSSFERADGYDAYYLQFMDGSELSMNNSSIRDAGYGEREKSGLYVNGDFSISNSSFRGDYAAIWAENVTGGRIYNSSFENERRGIFLKSCNLTTISSSSFSHHYNETIHMEKGHLNSVLNCTIYGAYGKYGRGIRAVNESFFTARGNDIDAVSFAGILIEGGDSSHNDIRENVLRRCGGGQISLLNTYGQRISGNVLGGAYMSIVAVACKNISIEDEKISDVSVGIRCESSNLSISGLSLVNVSSYGLISYRSNIILKEPHWENITQMGYFSDSLMFTDAHLNASEYRVVSSGRVYFYHDVSVKALDQKGNPMSNVSLFLSFENETLFTAITGENGTVKMPAPYMMHSVFGRNYSWCEVKAKARHHFRENPIRFYSWKTDEISFEEIPKELEIYIEPCPKELRPGDALSLNITVMKGNASVDGANITVYIGEKNVSRVSFIGNGTYFTSSTAPDFKDYLIIEVEAEKNGSAGVGRTRVMMADEVPPEIPQQSRENGLPYYYYIPTAFIVLLILLIFMRLMRRKKKEGFEGMAPVSPNVLEIEKR